MTSLTKMSVQTEPKKSPWAKIDTPNTDLYTLTDVMSEQLAVDLQSKETLDLPDTSTSPTEPVAASTGADFPVIPAENTDDDFLIAQLLQLEIDKEYDDSLKRRENVVNKNSHGR